MDDIIVSGGISNPLSKEGRAHAELYYKEIRTRTDEIAKIAKFTGLSEEEIIKVKNYLFNDVHKLITGIKRFDPSFEIAETWRRLADDHEHVQPHDRLLIPHELMEMKLIDSGLSQSEAHKLTSEKYDYPRASTEFYNQLQHLDHARIGHGTIISGGIDYWDEPEKKEEFQRRWELRM